MKEFTKEWMKKCNPDLILRWWRSKGSPGKLTISVYGVQMIYMRTIFGELRYMKKSGVKLKNVSKRYISLR